MTEQPPIPDQLLFKRLAEHGYEVPTIYDLISGYTWRPIDEGVLRILGDHLLDEDLLDIDLEYMARIIGRDGTPPESVEACLSALSTKGSKWVNPNCPRSLGWLLANAVSESCEIEHLESILDRLSDDSLGDHRKGLFDGVVKLMGPDSAGPLEPFLDNPGTASYAAAAAGKAKAVDLLDKVIAASEMNDDSYHRRLFKSAIKKLERAKSRAK